MGEPFFLLSKIISKINQNQFKKNDFDELSNSNNLVIEKVNFLNQLDNKKFFETNQQSHSNSY